MNNYLSLTLPGLKDGTTTINTIANNNSNFATIGSTVSAFLDVALYIAGFLMLFWLGWGVMQYIYAGGDKASLSKAKSRITWAIMGFVILVVAFFVSQYTAKLFERQNVNITNISR